MTALDTDLIVRLDRHVAAFAERSHVPGLAYGVIADGRLAHAGGVGAVRVGSDEPPAPDTVTRIASMTKSFTAAALLLLRDDGAIRLDEPVASYVPELTNLWPPTADSPEITLRHLMTMSAGLPLDDAWADRLLDLSPDDLASSFEAGATFSRPPGVSFEYSNLGWAMLGRVIADVAGAPPQTVISDRLLRPLALDRTTWEPPPDAVMTGYRWQDDTWAEEVRPLGDGGYAPMGGLWSTLADLGRWVAWLLDAFPPRNDPDSGPLSRASRREMQQVHRSWSRSDDADAGGYGYGLFVWVEGALGPMVAHSGGLPGYGSHMRWFPERGVGAVALGNLTYAPVRTLTLEILELLDRDGAIPPRVPAISDALAAACEGLARLLGRWDDALADALFADNVFLDEDRERRRGAASELLARIGPFEVGDVVPDGATAGSVRLIGERGSAEVELLLSPEVPPRIHWYEVTIPPTP